MGFVEMKRWYSWTSKLAVALCVVCVNVLLISRTNADNTVKSLAASKSIPAVIMFGDSIVDTGNNNYNTMSLAKCNFPPYGKDFVGGIPTGRFSNRKVPSDFIFIYNPIPFFSFFYFKLMLITITK